MKRRSPRFQLNKVTVQRIESKEVETLGKFEIMIIIDDYCHPICVHVILDTAIPYRHIIGIDFLNQFELIVKAGEAIIKPIADSNENNDDNNLPEIFKIDVINEEKPKEPNVDVSYIKNNNHKTILYKLINNYTPKRTHETNIKMKLVLKNGKPVY